MNGTLRSLQVFIGILIGLLGLSGVAAGVGYYLFITQISTHPPKPVFAEEREGSKTAISPKASQVPIATDGAIQKLAPSAYDAKVTWKDGLSLKKDPNLKAEKVGSVAFDAKVAIVKTSDDKEWVLVQPETDNIQGWVKANNIEKTAGTDNKEQAAPKRRNRKTVDENNPETTPKRTKRRVKVAPEPSADEENNQEEAAPKRTKRRAKPAPEPSADENNQEEAAPKQRTKRRAKPAPEPAADPQAEDGESSN
jgi:hypothetical protein